MRIFSTVAALILIVPAIAVAKDDTPNAHDLALQYPWHPDQPSTTKIELQCGKDRSTYELRVDDRDGVHLVGREWEALVAPFGRFLRTRGEWTKIDNKQWLAPRDHGLSLRELAGTPWLPEAWQIKDVRREKDASVTVIAADEQNVEHAMSFDAISNVWMAEKRGGKEWLKVVETKQLGVRMLPSKITVAGGCTLLKTVTPGMPSMPSRVELPE